MNGNIFFISTRQIGQVDFADPVFDGWDKFLFAAEEEVACLEHSLRSVFSDIFIADVASRDGVLTTYQHDSALLLFQRLKLDSKPLAIVCLDEGNTDLASMLRNRLSAAFVDVDPNIFRNKILMKRRLSGVGVRVPRFLECALKSEPPSWIDLRKDFGDKFVIKPVSSAGSNQVYIVDCAEDFQDAIETFKRMNLEFEIEEYIDGTLYHCDIALLSGRAIFNECVEYAAPTHCFQAGAPLGGIILPLTDPRRTKLISFALNAIQLLGASDGSYHTEIYITHSGELVFLETGARPAGMIVTKMYEQATGINPLNLEVRIRTGFSVPLCLSKRSAAFYLIYPKSKGVVKDVIEPPTVGGVNIHYSNTAGVGDEHNGCSSNIDLTSWIVASGPRESILDLYSKMKLFKAISYH